MGSRARVLSEAQAQAQSPAVGDGRKESEAAGEALDSGAGIAPLRVVPLRRFDGTSNSFVPRRGLDICTVQTTRQAASDTAVFSLHVGEAALRVREETATTTAWCLHLPQLRCACRGPQA